MRCGWGFYFRGAFEAQAGNSPLQGQSKPPAKLVVLILKQAHRPFTGRHRAEPEGEQAMPYRRIPMTMQPYRHL